MMIKILKRIFLTNKLFKKKKEENIKKSKYFNQDPLLQKPENSLEKSSIHTKRQTFHGRRNLKRKNPDEDFITDQNPHNHISTSRVHSYNPRLSTQRTTSTLRLLPQGPYIGSNSLEQTTWDGIFDVEDGSPVMDLNRVPEECGNNWRIFSTLRERDPMEEDCQLIEKRGSDIISLFHW